MSDTHWQDAIKALQADASAQRIARVYAEALLNAAEESGKVKEILDSLDALMAAHVDPDVQSFFHSGTVGRNQRRTTIEKTFEGRLDPLLVNFIQVLNDHERLALIRSVAVQYRTLLDERQGIGRVFVKSAVQLDEAQQSRLRAELSKVMVRQPVLELSVDPNLLGGLVVRAGDWLYDASVKNRVETMRKKLIEASSHEIQTGRDRFSSAI